MENINQTTSSVVETDQTSLIIKPPFESWWKVGVLVVGALLAGSITYAATNIPKNK